MTYSTFSSFRFHFAEKRLVRFTPPSTPSSAPSTSEGPEEPTISADIIRNPGESVGVEVTDTNTDVAVRSDMLNEFNSSVTTLNLSVPLTRMETYTVDAIPNMNFYDVFSDESQADNIIQAVNSSGLDGTTQMAILHSPKFLQEVGASSLPDILSLLERGDTLSSTERLVANNKYSDAITNNSAEPLAQKLKTIINTPDTEENMFDSMFAKLGDMYEKFIKPLLEFLGKFVHDFRMATNVQYKKNYEEHQRSPQGQLETVLKQLDTYPGDTEAQKKQHIQDQIDALHAQVLYPIIPNSEEHTKIEELNNALRTLEELYRRKDDLERQLQGGETQEEEEEIDQNTIKDIDSLISTLENTHKRYENLENQHKDASWYLTIGSWIPLSGFVSYIGSMYTNKMSKTAQDTKKKTMDYIKKLRALKAEFDTDQYGQIKQQVSSFLQELED